MPRNAVFSRVCGILVNLQRYRILSENGVVLGKNGVVNGVVKLGRRRQISGYEMNETHVLAVVSAWVFCFSGVLPYMVSIGELNSVLLI